MLAKYVSFCYNNGETKMRQLYGCANTRKACIGGLITYTTAIGRTAWDIIRQAAFFVKGLVCCGICAVVLPGFFFAV